MRTLHNVWPIAFNQRPQSPPMNYILALTTVAQRAMDFTKGEKQCMMNVLRFDFTEKSAESGIDKPMCYNFFETLI